MKSTSVLWQFIAWLFKMEKLSEFVVIVRHHFMG